MPTEEEWIEILQDALFTCINVLKSFQEQHKSTVIDAIEKSEKAILLCEEGWSVCDAGYGHHKKS